MIVLYPRLLPGEADRLFAELHDHPVGTHGTMVANHSPRAVFAATGGRRITRDELDDLRHAILTVAQEQGYPEQPGIAQRHAFDQRVARILHEQSLMVSGEAAQRQVWAFLALVLLPDVCVWRWQANADRRYLADRFKGSDLTRHSLARLWTRAHILHEPTAPEPYGLLDVLGEADLDQIMARRGSIAASSALVRAVVRGHRDDQGAIGAEATSRRILRECLMRLLRLTAFLDVDSMAEPELDHLVRMLRLESRTALQRSMS
ncbi:DUF6339 family protein [Kitasatospora purpeofusca]|uniref:DUF6339 family protein n=1 Tax=Kitasatospora purpeofusca TaxID=67352 RepID=UPI002A5A1D93|nr:DUF6339 family protein [Kitasatospora purpeofusca]MDY0810998.1 DUF6339 family protein [Kitasatospora purpeofusca]